MGGGNARLNKMSFQTVQYVEERRGWRRQEENGGGVEVDGLDWR